jgi:hypothetical protein
MDTITDILSTFFVTTNKQHTKSKKKKIKKVDKETQIDSFDTKINNENSEKSSQKPTIQNEEKHEIKTNDKQETKDEELKQETKDEEISQFDNDETKNEEISQIHDDNNEKKDSEYSSKTSLTQSITENSRISNNSLTASKSLSKSKNSSITENLSTDSSTSLPSSYKIKKFISKNEKFSNKNLLLMNKNLKLNLDMLNKILYDYSLMNDCKNKFEKYIYVISELSNKLEFKNMFDANPYLYFTDIKISSKLTGNMIKDFKEYNKKTILIMDGSIDPHIIITILDKLKKFNIHVIFLASNYSTTLYKRLNNLLNESCLLLHKNCKNLSNEKKFHKNIMEKIHSNINFDTYYNSFDNIVMSDYLIRYF